MTKNKIILPKEYPFKVRRNKRLKHAHLTINCDGSVIVTLPPRVPVNVVEKILQDRQEWLMKKIALRKKAPQSLLSKFSEKNYRKHKEGARQLVTSHLDHFNRFYKLKYNNLSIRNQKTRWGSCSSKKNLNFNYKIIFLPSEIRDYLIVHELCHLKELNHSKKFWNLVAKTCPDYKNLKRELSKV